MNGAEALCAGLCGGSGKAPAVASSSGNGGCVGTSSAGQSSAALLAAAGPRDTARDDGPGFPHNFDPSLSDRLGFRVLSSFARTLDGTLSFHSDDGAVTRLTFPAADPKAASVAE